MIKLVLSKPGRFVKAAGVGRALGTAASNSMNGGGGGWNSIQQLEDQVGWLKVELQNIKSMINDSTCGQKGPNEYATALKKVSRAVAGLKEDTMNGMKNLQKSNLLSLAIRTAEFNSFEYSAVEMREGKRNPRFGEADKSSKLAHDALFAFQSGHGYTVEEAVVGDPFSHDEVDDEQIKEFYTRFADQLHELLGVRPTMEFEENGRCTFSYPK